MTSFKHHVNYTTLLQYCNSEALDRYIALCDFHYNTQKSDLTESHHVFPRSIFGDNDITIHLPMMDHFKAHVLLMDSMKDDTAEIRSHKRMMCLAVHKMTQGREGFTPEDYKIARTAVQLARKGTMTAFDLREFCYVKIPTRFVDNKSRYFRTFDMIYVPTGKSIRLSVMDPRWPDCIANTKPGATKGYKRPDMIGRVLHEKNKNKFYDKSTKEYVCMLPSEAKKLGLVGCTTWHDNLTDSTAYISSIEAKAQPWRYTHTNAGKVDVYDTRLGKIIKIKTVDMDREFQMTQSSRRFKEEIKPFLTPKQT